MLQHLKTFCNNSKHSLLLLAAGLLFAFGGLLTASAQEVAPDTVFTETRELTGTLHRYAPFPTESLQARPVDVWLPPGYSSSSSTRYPVIYAHDGQNLFVPSWAFGGTAWDLDEAIAQGAAEGAMQEAIVVGIWNTDARYAEYMPEYAACGESISIHAGGLPPLDRSHLQSEAYLQFLVEELKPFVDQTYRTRPEREHTFVMGSSMGGLISAYAVIRYPNVFGGAAALSTHWPAGDGCVISYLAERLPSPRSHRLYFDHGTETLDAHYGPYQKRMNRALREAGYAHGKTFVSRVFPGDEHSESAWRDRVQIPLRFLLHP